MLRRCADERQCELRRVYWWNTFTPQFETAIMIVSGPVTLLVALWGMTSARTREVQLFSFGVVCADFFFWSYLCRFFLLELFVQIFLLELFVRSHVAAKSARLGVRFGLTARFSGVGFNVSCRQAVQRNEFFEMKWHWNA
jgi:hypothetical protein